MKEFPENNLYPLWQDFCNKKRSSVDRRISGYSSGELNRFDGPDFQGAEVEIDGIRYRGDVEIHLDRQDWYNHGHHLDSRYDQVVLHLVWNYKQGKALRPVVNSKNLFIPTYTLQDLTCSQPQEELMNIPTCRLPVTASERFWSQLQVLALERLHEKGRQIQHMLAGAGKEQILYQLLVRILGSPNNSDNFEQVARLLSWSELQVLKRTVHPPIELWLGLFLYISGFLEHDQRFEVVRKRIGNISAVYSGSRMPPVLWKTAGQRPWNNPLHRLQGLAHFVHQWKGSSLFQTFREQFVMRRPLQELLKSLYSLLNPQPSRFWYQHLYRATVDPKVFWGQSSRLELIGNVLVPFFYQEALAAGSEGFAGYLEEFYLFLPYSGGYGRLTPFYDWPEWREIQGSKKFYLNQALLKLLQEFCQNQSCNQCPLGRIQ
jgi:hypothetical protein